VRILFISQYFPPEMGAPAARVHELARRWSQLGHDVTVLTAFPNHPTGVIPPEYRLKVFAREKKDGITVVRTFIYAAPNRGIVRRALSYASFLASSLLVGTWLTFRPDVIVATSPQFLVAVAGYVMSLLKRRPLVLEIRDLWPDSIVAVGALPSGHVLVRILHRLERFLYRRSDAIVVVTRSFARELERRGVPAEKMTVITNGVDLGLFADSGRRDEARRRFDFEGRFVCLYLGTIGMAHGLETVLSAARQLQSREPDVLFVFVGEGARRAEIEDAARDLHNVRFLGQRPRAEVPDLLTASDVSLVILRDTPLFATVIPSKMFEAMGAQRPIVLGVRGEAAELLEEAGAGVCIPPEDDRSLAEAILRLKADPGEAARLGRNGRLAAERLYDRDRLAETYVSWLAERF
jgi:colanic acid biosynthesis glycosyl transferase WcaI